MFLTTCVNKSYIQVKRSICQIVDGLYVSDCCNVPYPDITFILDSLQTVFGSNH